MSTYQMCILVLFNQRNSFSLAEIRQATDIPELELRRHLLSLCTPKIKILKKASKGKVRKFFCTIKCILIFLCYVRNCVSVQNIEEDDEFTFNEEFTSKFKRIKVPLVSAKEVIIEGNSEAGAGKNLPNNIYDSQTSTNF